MHIYIAFYRAIHIDHHVVSPQTEQYQSLLSGCAEGKQRNGITPYKTKPCYRAAPNGVRAHPRIGATRVLPRLPPHASQCEALWASRGLASGAPSTSRVEAAQLSDHHGPALFGRRIAFPIKALLDCVPRATVQAPPAILNVRVDAALFVVQRFLFPSARESQVWVCSR